jgi:hypothetical protein
VTARRDAAEVKPDRSVVRKDTPEDFFAGD